MVTAFCLLAGSWIFQPEDSLERKFPMRHYAAPIVLSGAAALSWRDAGWFSRGAVADWRQRNHPDFSHDADDYLQFAPLATMAVLHLAQVEAGNGLERWRDQLELAAGSQLVMLALVFPLKELTAVERPNGANKHAFPSGHTAQAFVAATLLHRAYGDRSVWYSIGGYAAATVTGSMRILNNEHWFTDVLAGAAIGILSVNLVDDLRRARRRRTKNEVFVFPSWNRGPAVGMQIRFR